VRNGKAHTRLVQGVVASSILKSQRRPLVKERA
jgi:hypothetical protein